MTRYSAYRFAHSLHLRLRGLTLGIALLFCLVAGVMVFFSQKDTADKSFIETGQQRAEAVAALVSHSRDSLEAVASAAATQPDVLEVTFHTAGGKAIARHVRPNPGNVPQRAFRVPVKYFSGDEGMLELRLAHPKETAGSAWIFWFFAVMAILCAGILFLLLNRMVVIPLERLQQQARELADERALDAPIILKIKGYPQLQELTDILNTMSRRVFDVKQQMEDKVNHANAALVSTVGQLQSRSAELRDRTQELEIALEAIRRMATTDSLTGVHNRRYFDERLGDALARLQRSQLPLSIILFDIDKFKHINDTLGHAAGDIVLEHLARLIKARTRASDVFARLGGDEFAFIMEDTNLQEAQKLGNDLLTSVRAYQFSYEGRGIPVTLSIGIAHFDHPPRDEEIIYKVTDDALYDAKRGGRNQVVAYSFDANGNRLIVPPEKIA